MSVYQFTTPLVSIEMPEDIPVASIDKLVVTLKQDAIKLCKSNSEVLLDSETNSVIVSLTQEETGAFRKGQMSVQLHFSVDGEVMASDTAWITVDENIHGEALV